MKLFKNPKRNFELFVSDAPDSLINKYNIWVCIYICIYIFFLKTVKSFLSLILNILAPSTLFSKYVE